MKGDIFRITVFEQIDGACYVWHFEEVLNRVLKIFSLNVNISLEINFDIIPLCYKDWIIKYLKLKFSLEQNYES